jgi:Asp-tRNA(Asn)/Glu-tRNA(Gln) amidotransferase A subunit family amidase
VRGADPILPRMVKAWLSLDPEHVIRRARELDKLPWKGPLHGIPWGVKDVIDSADYPTTQNSAIYDSLKVGRDAAPVVVARGSGALVLGKTDTVEFASGGRKALTTNPYNPEHTLGGSSSGSGAAVGVFRCRTHLAPKRAGRIPGLPRSTAFMA